MPNIDRNVNRNSIWLIYWKSKKYYKVIIACSFATIAGFLLLFTQIGGLYVVLPTLFVIGFASGYQVIIIYIALSYVNNNSKPGNGYVKHGSNGLAILVYTWFTLGSQK